jgi:hypothetical protein
MKAAVDDFSKPLFGETDVFVPIASVIDPIGSRAPVRDPVFMNAGSANGNLP